MHYCGGELKTIDVNSEQQECCCGAESAACCENETLILEINLDQNSSIIKSEIPKNIEIDSELFLTTYMLDNEEEKVLTDYILLKPPKKEPVWLLNCTFTYYG